MSILLLFLAVALCVAMIAAIAAIRLTRRARLHAATDSVDLDQIARWTSRWRWAGIGAGAALAYLALGLDSDGSYGTGRLAMVAPAIAGVVILTATTIGEITARPRRGQVRSASLGTRSLPALLPRARTALVAAGVLALAITLTVGVTLGSPDDLGRAGRSLTASCVQDLPGSGPSLVTSVNGPWPGSFYATPIVAVMLLALATGVLGARAVRDRANPDATHASVDDALRRAAVGKILSALGATTFATLGPLLIFMASALAANDCLRGGGTYAIPLVLLALASFLAAIILMAALVLPGRGSTASADVEAKPRIHT